MNVKKCRLCLKTDVIVNDIIGSNIKCSELSLIESLYWIFGVEVDVNDFYSKWICIHCEHVVKYVGFYRTLFHKNQLILVGKLSDRTESQDKEIYDSLKKLTSEATRQLDNHILNNTNTVDSESDILSPRQKERRRRLVDYYYRFPTTAIRSLIKRKYLQSYQKRTMNIQPLVKVVDSVEVNVCKYCSMIFTNQHNLLAHYETKHESRDGNVDSDKPQGIKKKRYRRKLTQKKQHLKKMCERLKWLLNKSRPEEETSKIEERPVAQNESITFEKDTLKEIVVDNDKCLPKANKQTLETNEADRYKWLNLKQFCISVKRCEVPVTFEGRFDDENDTCNNNDDSLVSQPDNMDRNCTSGTYSRSDMMTLEDMVNDSDDSVVYEITVFDKTLNTSEKTPADVSVASETNAISEINEPTPMEDFDDDFVDIETIMAKTSEMSSSMPMEDFDDDFVDVETIEAETTEIIEIINTNDNSITFGSKIVDKTSEFTPLEDKIDNSIDKSVVSDTSIVADTTKVIDIRKMKASLSSALNKIKLIETTPTPLNTTETTKEIERTSVCHNQTTIDPDLETEFQKLDRSYKRGILSSALNRIKHIETMSNSLNMTGMTKEIERTTSDPDLKTEIHKLNSGFERSKRKHPIKAYQRPAIKSLKKRGRRRRAKKNIKINGWKSTEIKDSGTECQLPNQCSERNEDLSDISRSTNLGGTETYERNIGSSEEGLVLIINDETEVQLPNGFSKRIVYPENALLTSQDVKDHVSQLNLRNNLDSSKTTVIEAEVEGTKLQNDIPVASNSCEGDNIETHHMNADSDALFTTQVENDLHIRYDLKDFCIAVKKCAVPSNFYHSSTTNAREEYKKKSEKTKKKRALDTNIKREADPDSSLFVVHHSEPSEFNSPAVTVKEDNVLTTESFKGTKKWRGNLHDTLLKVRDITRRLISHKSYTGASVDQINSTPNPAYTLKEVTICLPRIDPELSKYVKRTSNLKTVSVSGGRRTPQLERTRKRVRTPQLEPTRKSVRNSIPLLEKETDHKDKPREDFPEEPPVLEPQVLNSKPAGTAAKKNKNARTKLQVDNSANKQQAQNERPETEMENTVCMVKQVEELSESFMLFKIIDKGVNETASAMLSDEKS